MATAVLGASQSESESSVLGGIAAPVVLAGRRMVALSKLVAVTLMQDGVEYASMAGCMPLLDMEAFLATWHVQQFSYDIASATLNGH